MTDGVAKEIRLTVTPDDYRRIHYALMMTANWQSLPQYRDEFWALINKLDAQECEQNPTPSEEPAYDD